MLSNKQIRKMEERKNLLKDWIIPLRQSSEEAMEKFNQYMDGREKKRLETIYSKLRELEWIIEETIKED